jgi:hypothetical protein
MAVFWVIAPCSLLVVYNVSEVFAASIIALMMKAARASQTLVNFYQTTRRYNPEDSHLRTHRREKLKSDFYNQFGLCGAGLLVFPFVIYYILFWCYAGNEP